MIPSAEALVALELLVERTAVHPLTLAPIAATAAALLESGWIALAGRYDDPLVSITSQGVRVLADWRAEEEAKEELLKKLRFRADLYKRSSRSDAFVSYVRLSDALPFLDAANREAGDAVRDLMDGLWHALTDEEREAVGQMEPSAENLK